MELDFRQGIVRYQQDIANNPSFLTISALDNNYIDLIVAPDPTIVTFAHSTSDYSIEESVTVRDAWGPFAPIGQTQYLYWNIDQVSGRLSRWFTTLPPIVSFNEPVVKREDQHWFDLHVNIMKVYHNHHWQPVLRVFAAIYNNTANIIYYQLGSQTDLTGRRRSGFIIFDAEDEPIRNRLGNFITSEHKLLTHNVRSSANSSSMGFQLEGLIKIVSSDTPISKLSLVSLVGPNKIEAATFTRTDRLITGIIGEDLWPNEDGRLITGGRIRNTSFFNFSINQINKSLFCDLHGQLTTTPPPSGISQIVGYVVDVDSVFIDIHSPIVL